MLAFVLAEVGVLRSFRFAGLKGVVFLYGFNAEFAQLLSEVIDKVIVDEECGDLTVRVVDVEYAERLNAKLAEAARSLAGGTRA